MSVLFTQEVSYFECTFTIPHDRRANATIGNLTREVQTIVNPVGATVDARYGKGFEYVHFTVEFSDVEEYAQVMKELEAWATEHGAK